MSVDYSAILGYGFLITNDEAYDYRDKLEEKEEEQSDFFLWINDYSDSSYCFFGVIAYSTDHITSLDRTTDPIDPEKWDACYSDFLEAFPEKQNEKPQFYLICGVW